MNTNNFKYLIFKYLWIVLLIPKSLQLFIICIFIILALFSNRKQLKLDIISLSLIAYSCIHFVSIIYRLAVTQSVERAGAAFNTVSIMVVATIFYMVIRSLEFNYDKISKYMFINMNIMLVITFIYIMNTTYGINFLSNVFNRSLYRDDWLFGEREERLVAYLEYSNLVAMFYLTVGPWAITYVKDNYNKIIVLLYCLFSFISVYLSNSRMGIIATLFTLVAILYSGIQNKKMKVFLTFFGTGILFCLIVINYESIITSLNDLFYSRSGSNDTRMQLYENSINLTLEESPLIGIGIKYMRGAYPLGSHSTYIGFLYKAGLLGIIPAVISITTIFFRTIKVYTIKIDEMKIHAVFMLAILLIAMITEDIDGANWLIVLFLINVGYIMECYYSKNVYTYPKSNKPILNGFNLRVRSL